MKNYVSLPFILGTVLKRSNVHEDDDDDEETKLKSLFTLLLLDVTASLSISHPSRSLSEAKF